MWLWGVWLGRSVAKRHYVGRRALFWERLGFGSQNRGQAVFDDTDDTIQLFTLRSIKW